MLNATDDRPAKICFWFGALILFACFQSVRSPLIAAEREQQPMAGELLVASEAMKDPRFFESVIYLVKHDLDGTLGLIINRPLAHGPIDDLLKGFGAEATGSRSEITVHYGGPVSSRQGFLLHSDDKTVEGASQSPNGIALTSDIKMIQAIANGTGPQQFLFALGYAGWAPGQLEDELKANSWFLVSADKSLVFGKNAGEKWRRALDKRRIRL
jgi:putative transcriptional regulator